MTNNNIIILSLSILALIFTIPLQGQGQDKLPIREYTNPDEMVTFDRTTPFTRALDVINDFSQDARGKVVIDRTGQTESIGITVPPMHWEDALDLILRVNGLVLLENQKFFEIVKAQTSGAQTTQQTSSQQAVVDGEGPPATTKSREVRINAIFFEGNKRALQEIGVDWSTLSENVPDNIGSFANPQQGGGGGGGGGGQGGQNQGQLPSTSFDDQFVSVNSKGAQSVSQNVFNSIINFGEIGNSGIRVQALFSAFEADNLGEILASPTVKVLDGQEGRIQVGQDFSIKQRDFAGNVTDQFFSVGTILQVTPQIIEQQDTTFIHLTIEAERSSAQPDPVSTIINKQEATTQTLLIDGEATVIAGLYRTESAEVRRGVPILKDLPGWFFGLKYLFGYNSKDYQMRELVILIQATIEPSIPTRYAQSDYKDKYEILGEERRRIRDELSKSSMNTGDLIDKKDDEDADQNGQQADENEEQQDMEGSEDEAAQEENKPVAQNFPKEEKQKKVQPRENNNTTASKLSTDPEVKPKSVPLNFGNDKTEERDSSSSKMSQGSSEMKKETSSASSSVEASTKAEPKRSSASGYTYYIIGASFKKEQNAVEYKDKLAGKEFPAVILSKPDSDFFFVAYNQYGRLDQAKIALQDIKQYENEGAWIYRTN